VHLKSIIHELLWFLRGETNVGSLQAAGVSIWDEWADATGDLGRVYGAQWTDWRSPDGRSINQIRDLVERLRKDPDSRRRLGERSRARVWRESGIDDVAPRLLACMERAVAAGPHHG
jgi:thymidylate synthase